jgi:PKD repeat protein
MDVGVYTKDATSTTWTLYNNGLPNVPISDFDISPAAPGLLRVATYGRGVYQVDLIQGGALPASDFSYTGTFCQGTANIFTDNSTESPTAWSWSVSPSSGVVIASSTSQNPAITFGSSGTFTVSMTASNAFGWGSTVTKTVTVNPAPSLTVNSTQALETVCVNDAIMLTASGANSYTWLPPASTGASLNMTVSLSTPSSYTVNAGSLQGCLSSTVITLKISECTSISEFKGTGSQFEIYPNPAYQYVKIKMKDVSDSKVEVFLTDASGKLILRTTHHFKKDSNVMEVDMKDLPKGIYFLDLKVGQGNAPRYKFVKE